MRTRAIFRTVTPYLTAIGVIIITALLVVAIYFTELNLQWVTFLTGVLAAAILSMVSRTSRAEWIIARREAKVSALQEKLGSEMRLRRELEQKLAAGKLQLHLVNEVLPVMAAYIDSGGAFRFHNRAFRDWLNLSAEHIDGRPMREVLGAGTYGEISTAVAQALTGQPMLFEQAYRMLSGERHRFSVHLLPHRDDTSAATGFFMLQTVIKETGDKQASPATTAPVAAMNGSAQDMFVQSFSEEVAGQNDPVNRILAAIEQNEFRLYCQLISPLAADAGLPNHYEVLIRLIEEEEGMMPPGAFFPLVEQYGLMPRLDRWVVQHVVEWVMQHKARLQLENSTFFINLASATLSDSEFPEFVRNQLRTCGVPANILCFEIIDSGLSMQRTDVVTFAHKMKSCGCALAFGNFGRNGVSFKSLQGVKVDFLKIDGSIILDILRDPTDLAQAAAIARVAKTINVKTIAEFVESEACIQKLREINVDFAQGFQISAPRPLTEIG